jgi:hypothetical protein
LSPANFRSRSATKQSGSGLIHGHNPPPPFLQSNDGTASPRPPAPATATWVWEPALHLVRFPEFHISMLSRHHSFSTKPEIKSFSWKKSHRTERLKNNVRHLHVKTLFPQTLNRMDYFLRLLLFLGGVLLLRQLARPFHVPLWLTVLILCILFAIRFMCLDIPRLRSIRWHLWLLLLLVIPPVNLIFQLVLLLIPGKEADV